MMQKLLLLEHPNPIRKPNEERRRRKSILPSQRNWRGWKR